MNVLLLIFAIVVISAVVGVIAQFLNKLNELNAPPGRRPAARVADGRAATSADKDMDRFLAEIDRLRRKNAEGGPGQPTPAVRQRADGTPTPVARPARPPERQRARVVAELADPQPKPRRGVDRSEMAAPPVPVQPGSLSPAIQVEELPVATVVAPTASTGAPATRVTRLPDRARPAPKTDLAKNLTGLLNSGQGIAMAVILQEVLGPPKCRKHA